MSIPSTFAISAYDLPLDAQRQLRLSPDYLAQWARSEAREGSSAAQLILGHLLLNGHGVEVDYAAAYRAFLDAARDDSADAMNMVGRCYERGWGVPVDFAEAAMWYRRAAERSHTWAQFNLGSLLLHGQGVSADLQEALALFVRSARGGNAKAMNMLGRYREEGWVAGVKLNSARRWYWRAAIRGCYRGQFHFGRFLSDEGQVAKATSWFQASLENAPREFTIEIAPYLARHADQRIRSVGLAALERLKTTEPSGRTAE